MAGHETPQDDDRTDPGWAHLPDERLRQIDAVFVRVLELDESARAAFLDRSCADDPALRRQVESLLAAATEDVAGSDLLSPGGAVDERLLEDAEERLREPFETRIGRYRIERLIGRGGMGEVYLARRDDGHFRQRVALKLLPAGAGRHAAERFARERQLLASIEHPNIARLIDGGVSPGGRPFLVMELVEGEPLDRFCASRRLSLRARLELLVTVCRAVQAAHRQLIVHRDVKPSNVLVTRAGEIKLLDFGIAKLLADGHQADPTLTRLAGRALTLQYASPEMLRGEPVTVASDIYQLGLLTYEILTGRRPYELGDLAPIQAAHHICEQPVEAPSLAVGRGAPGGPPGLPGSPAALRRALAGDLDTIVFKALRKEPSRRYGSADLLRQDFENFLAGLPVSARPDTWSYRWGKFIRRNAWPTAIAAGATLTIAGLVAGFGWRLAIENRETRAAAERAETLREESEEVVNFLVDLFADSDPYAATPDADLSAREMLLAGGARLVEGIGTRPETRRRLMREIGSIQRLLGMFETAEELVANALTLCRETPDCGPEELAESLHDLAKVQLADRGRLDEARALMTESIALDENPRALIDLGLVHHNLGDLDAAESAYRRALELHERRSGTDDLDAALLMTALAGVLAERDDLDPARELYQRALTIQERELGPDHLRIADTLAFLAGIDYRQGRFATAAELQMRRVRAQEQALGEDHPVLSRSLLSLAETCRRLGRLEDAEKAVRRAIDIREAAHGKDHPEVAVAVYHLGTILLERGDSRGGEPVLRRAFVLLRNAPGGRHQYLPFVGVTLGRCLVANGRYDDAEPLLRQGRESFAKQYGARHPNVAEVLLELAQIERHRGHLDAAERLLREAVEIHREKSPPGHPDRQRALSLLNDFLRGARSAVD